MSLLEEFTVNMLDRVDEYKNLIGREKELSNVIEVLNRKEKSNPVLIGEAGVGKTAIVEGLAQRVAEEEVPTKMIGMELLELNVSEVISKGQMMGLGNLVKAIMEEVKASETMIVLFIDELHMIMDSGNSKTEFADALKPYLARGGVRVIGATTTKEYKAIESDKAMERRLTQVFVDEPSVEVTVEILEGIVESFADYHEVNYEEGVLEYITKVSRQYMPERTLPDKAIDLMDIVGAKRNLTFGTPNTDDYDAQIHELSGNYFEKVASGLYVDAHLLKEQVEAKEQEKTSYIDELSQERNNLITRNDVKLILEAFLGVEIEVNLEDEGDYSHLNTLEDELKGKVIGQDKAVNAIAQSIIRHKVGLSDPEKPIGSFLLYGPTGVGKTEIAKQIAEKMFGDKENIVRLDMNEFSEKHTVSKLLGSPAGYVGYGDGSSPFEKLRKRPSQVVLVDEVEKAHPIVLNTFLNILDEGHVTDSSNNKINFKETILIFTTNAKPDNEVTTGQVGFTMNEEPQDGSQTLVPKFTAFAPEFLNRFTDIIEFKPLGKEELVKILDLQIGELNKRFEDRGYEVKLTNPAKVKVVSISYDKEKGARPLERNLSRIVEDKMTRRLLSGNNNKEFNFVLRDGQVELENMYTEGTVAEGSLQIETT